MLKKEISKFKHTYGTVAQATDCLNSVAVGSCGADSNVLQSNAKYFAFPHKATGSIAVVNLSSKGSLSDDTPMLLHEEQVNEIAFSPFKNDHLLISACQDTIARLWNVDELPGSTSTPLVSLSGHTKRLLSAGFHPLAREVVYTISVDEIKLWDVESKIAMVNLAPVHKGMVTSLSWDYSGVTFTTTCKDKMLRIFDPRSNTMVSQVADHQGTKGSRALFCGNKDLIFSVGFTKNMDREASLWDVRNMKDRISSLKLDISPSSPMPFYDTDTNVVFLGGKGDSGVKILEVSPTNTIELLGDFKHKDSTAGMTMLPKSTCDVMKCEIAKTLKLTPSGQVLPIRFEVQRASNLYFQEELFPDTWNEEPTTNSQKWFSGENVQKTLKSLNPSK